MIHYDNWFPTTVFYSDANCMENIAEYQIIANSIMSELQFEKHPFGESKLSTSFWHSVHGHLYRDIRFKKITEEIITQSLDCFEILGYGKVKREQVKFLNQWLNFIGPNDYHALHVHNTIGRALLSGVYYIDAPKNSQINFASPYRDTYIPVKPYFDTYENFSKVTYDCVPGRIIMFKSSVYHGYDAHESDYIKISMPFNLALEYHAS